MLKHLSNEKLVEYHELYKSKATNTRFDLVKKHSYDCKYSYHLVRLLLECEQLLTEGNLDLKRDSELYKSIRRGEWTLENLEKWFFDKERHLEEIYNKSALPYGPQENKIRDLLIKCLEYHYGTVDVRVPKKEEELLREIAKLVRDY